MRCPLGKRRNRPFIILLLQGQRGRRINAARFKTPAVELCCQIHRETTCVSSRNQLLWNCSGRTLKPTANTFESTPLARHILFVDTKTGTGSYPTRLRGSVQARTNTLPPPRRHCDRRCSIRPLFPTMSPDIPGLRCPWTHYRVGKCLLKLWNIEPVVNFIFTLELGRLRYWPCGRRANSLSPAETFDTDPRVSLFHLKSSISRAPGRPFDVSHELTSRGIDKFVNDYRKTLASS